MVLKTMEPIHVKKMKKKTKKNNEKVMKKVVKNTKEMGFPEVHVQVKNGVNYEHDQNVEEKEETDVHTTYHEGSNH